MAISPCSSITNKQNKEMVRHGTTAFPIACYADDLTEQSVPWHWHEEFEYAIVTEGNAEFLLENGKVHLQTGQGIFINSSALHAVDQLGLGISGLHSAVFHPRLIGGTMDSVFWQHLVQPLLTNPSLRFLVLTPDHSWQEQVLSHFHTVWEIIRVESADYENLVRYHLSAALRLLHENAPTGCSIPSQQDLVEAERIRTMLEFIENHYMEELTIDQIASTVSISGSACLRCFKQMLGTSPIQYVKQLRLEKAAELLRTTNKTAKEIALECGFNDVSYFTKAFRTKKGMTPKEFQNSKHPTQAPQSSPYKS